MSCPSSSSTDMFGDDIGAETNPFLIEDPEQAFQAAWRRFASIQAPPMTPGGQGGDIPGRVAATTEADPLDSSQDGVAFASVRASAADACEVPSSSQSCINLTPQATQPAFRAALDLIKIAGLTEPPDWDRIFLDECFRDTPVAIQDRMVAHFTKLIQDAKLAQERRAEARTAGQKRGADPCPRCSSAIPGGCLAAGASGEERYPPTGEQPGSHSSGEALPSVHQRASSSGAAAVPRTAGVVGSTSGGAIPGGARGGTRMEERSNGDAVRGESTVGGCEPALSNAARAALCGTRTGLHTMWRYRGLIEWRGRGGVTVDRTLSLDEVVAASANRGKGAQRYPNLRERWECRTCGILRHEPVGSTTNLTKHSKSHV
ncbi:hypothetical protein OC835_004140 [Tilletia horrida]|nr:hypothetical protein OC835_004140 [Tilletia horrida]